MHCFYSSDEGLTWTNGVRLPHRGDAPSAVVTRDGYLVVAHRHPHTSITISPDNGRSWTRPWVLDTVGGAYPGLVELDDGSVFCVYYEEGKASNIRMSIFRIAPGIDVQDLSARWPTPPPPGSRLDLGALYAAERIKVDTDLTATHESLRGCGPAAVFDSNTAYARAAWKAENNAPSHYTIELDRPYTMTGLGICLKTSEPGREFKETADVFVSQDGTEWGESVVTLEDAATTGVRHFRFDQPLSARFLRVDIRAADGWPSLNEIEIYATDAAVTE